MNNQNRSLVPANSLSTSVSSSQWSGISSVFRNDIFWGIIAVGCILGVILFYFQGVQPLLLRRYIYEARSQTFELQSLLSQQVESVLIHQQNMYSRFTFSPFGLCNDIPLYNFFDEDLQEYDRLQVTVLEKTEFKDVLNPTVFYSPDIQLMYDTVYADYSESIKIVQQSAKKTHGIPQYLQYMNSWIETCNVVEDSSFADVSLIQDSCLSLENIYTQFIQGQIPMFWGEIQAEHETSIELCRNLNEESLSTSSFATWKLSFSDTFDSIYRFIPEEGVDVFLEEVVNEFSESSSQVLISMNEELIRKMSLTGMWYILPLSF